MIKKIIICFFSLLSCLILPEAYADNPNLYTCKGNNVSLTYRTFSFGPETPDTVFLTMKIGNKNYSAGKAGIESHKSVMGDVKSIVLKFTPDVSINKASFILPQINLGQNNLGTLITKAGFKSQLALTTIATPFIPGPYIGVVNKSNYIDLNCTATLLLVEPL
ncbi:MAG: hypothetical protein IPN42_04265 [Methylococcaceae bacterium]|nr:hypothetical protein [Methylococcaceae bacterium]